MYICNVPWRWPVCYAFDFCWIHLYSSVFKDYSQEFNSLLIEDTFFWFKVEVVLLQFVKHSVYTLVMEFLVVFGGYQDVIHIYDQPSFCDFFSKNHIHHHLEGSRGVG